METKYIKPRKLRGNSETLIGSAWTFLEKGRDDFRDGLPPEANYDYIKKVSCMNDWPDKCAYFWSNFRIPGHFIYICQCALKNEVY